jgi:hypothetical protein
MARSYFRWDPKGELNSPITAGSEVVEVTHDKFALEAVLPVCEPEV